MSDSSKLCLLLEPGEKAAADITESLKLLKYEVRHVEDIEEATSLISKMPPSLILVRVNPEQAPGVGLAFLNVISSHPISKAVPIVGLCTEGEVERFQGETHLFFEMVSLPVVFPNFTREIERTIVRFETQFGPISLEGLTEGEHDFLPIPEVASVQKESNSGSDAEVSDRTKRLAGLHILQLQVLERIQSDPSLVQVAVSDLPDLLLQITTEICQNADIDTLFEN